MRIYYNFDQYQVQQPVITTGVFDGVHKGHVEILNRLKDAAKKRNGQSVVVTFWPHPKLVVQSDYHLKLLNTLEEKFSLLEINHIDNVVVLPFTSELAALSAEEYVQEFIVTKLNTKHLIMGFNHHFGRGREGNFDLMENFGSKYDFSVEKLEPWLVENEKVSSTLIRKSLADGEIQQANNYLGYTYMLTGKVVEGNRLGRTIGFPTANVLVEQDYKLIPKAGVYAVEVDCDGKRYPGMLNMGFRPTVNINPNQMSIEVHLINFDGDLYNKQITLLFKQFVRNEKKFDNIEVLKEQLNVDKTRISKILGI